MHCQRVQKPRDCRCRRPERRVHDRASLAGHFLAALALTASSGLLGQRREHQQAERHVLGAQAAESRHFAAHARAVVVAPPRAHLYEEGGEGGGHALADHAVAGVTEANLGEEEGGRGEGEREKKENEIEKEQEKKKETEKVEEK